MNEKLIKQLREGTMKNNTPETQQPILERATFEFSQEANCLSNPDEAEFLTIECENDLGIDRDGNLFYVLKTEKWSIENENDLKILFDRIQKVIKK